MKILIYSTGSRGDVEPFVALCNGLSSRGHHVLFGAMELFRGLVEEYSIPNFTFVSLGESKWNDQRVISGVKILSDTGDQLPLWKAIAEVGMGDIACEDIKLLEKAAENVGGVDIVLGSTICHPILQSFAEAKGIPAILIHLQPQVPTHYFPHHADHGYKDRNKRVEYLKISEKKQNYLDTYKEIEEVCFQGCVSKLNQYRLEKQLSLVNWDSWWDRVTGNLEGTHIMSAYSSFLVPTPPDFAESAKHIVGPWVAQPKDVRNWSPSSELIEFLDTKNNTRQKPIFIGWGSMTLSSVSDNGRAHLSRIAFHALWKAQKRGIVQRGWARLSPESLLETPSDNPEQDKEIVEWAKENVLVVDSVPHQFLLPKCLLAVHHGGAGTTHASLRAGCITLINPFIADQHMWGSRVSHLGVGDVTTPLAKLTGEELAQYIERWSDDDEAKKRIELLSHNMQKEDGILNAANVIESLVKAEN